MRLPKQAKSTIQIPVPVAMDRPVGLGDIIKGLTTRLGMTPCTPCERRAATMNRYISFSGRAAQHQQIPSRQL
jgi:hypothetical protein